MTQLRAAHARGETSAGLDVVKGEVGDMWALGIREAYKSKLQVRVGALGVGSCCAVSAKLYTSALWLGLGLQVKASAYTRFMLGDFLLSVIVSPMCCCVQVLVSAAEAAEMILRVDDIIKCAPRERDNRH